MDVQCAKCGAPELETSTIRTTGSGFTRFFNVQRYKFGAVTCAKCGYTELYRVRAGGRVANVFDFLAN